MKNADIFLNLKDLGTKYADLGLFISIEFDEYGMIFRGYWMNPITLNDTLYFNKRYAYDLIKNLSDDIDMEFLIDEFKKEFKEEERKHIGELNDDTKSDIRTL